MAEEFAEHQDAIKRRRESIAAQVAGGIYSQLTQSGHLSRAAKTAVESLRIADAIIAEVDNE